MTDTRKLFISDSAAKHIANVAAKQNNPDLGFRITVSGGGCSGFKYIYEFDDAVDNADRVFEKNGIKVITDDMSLNFLNGSELDFVQDLMGSRFFVENPNANSSCGCGTSFSMNFDNAPQTVSSPQSSE